jgi:hypothetical protein
MTAREAGAPVSMRQRPSQRRRNRPRPSPDLHHLPVLVVPHHHPARVTRQPPRRFRGNVAALLQHGLAGLLGIRQHGRVDVNHHLVPLPRGPGIERVMQRRLRQQRQRVRLPVDPAPAPDDPLDVGRRARAPHREQPGLGLRGRYAGQGAHLGIRKLPARQSLGQGRQRPEGARDPNPLPGCPQIEPRTPGEPGGAGAEPGVPAPTGVELPDEGEQAGRRRLEVGRELSDLVAKAIERGGVGCGHRHGESPLSAGATLHPDIGNPRTPPGRMNGASAMIARPWRHGCPSRAGGEGAQPAFPHRIQCALGLHAAGRQAKSAGGASQRASLRREKGTHGLIFAQLDRPRVDAPRLIRPAEPVQEVGPERRVGLIARRSERCGRALRTAARSRPSRSNRCVRAARAPTGWRPRAGSGPASLRARRRAACARPPRSSARPIARRPGGRAARSRRSRRGGPPTAPRSGVRLVGTQ